MVPAPSVWLALVARLGLVELPPAQDLTASLWPRAATRLRALLLSVWLEELLRWPSHAVHGVVGGARAVAWVLLRLLVPGRAARVELPLWWAVALRLVRVLLGLLLWTLIAVVEVAPPDRHP